MRGISDDPRGQTRAAPRPCLLHRDVEKLRTTVIDPDARKFLRYNANKALMNLGCEGCFLESRREPAVVTGVPRR